MKATGYAAYGLEDCTPQQVARIYDHQRDCEYSIYGSVPDEMYALLDSK